MLRMKWGGVLKGFEVSDEGLEHLVLENEVPGGTITWCHDQQPLVFVVSKEGKLQAIFCFSPGEDLEARLYDAREALVFHGFRDTPWHTGKVLPGEIARWKSFKKDEGWTTLIFLDASLTTTLQVSLSDMAAEMRHMAGEM